MKKPPSKQTQKRKSVAKKASPPRLQSLPSFLRSPVGIILILALVMIGILLIALSRAATSPTILTPQTASSPSCGARVTNYSYRVPFGNAPWNVPACNMPKFSQSADYVSRLYNYGNQNDGSAAGLTSRGKFQIGFGLGELKTVFSRAIYTADEAAGKTIQVRVCGNPNCVPSNLDGELKYGDPKGYLPDMRIPWDPNWPVAEAGDNEVVILNPTNGQLIALAQVKKSTGNALGDILSGATGQCGILYPERLCVASAKILRDQNGNIANYFTYEGSSGDRGGGISYYAGIITPQEVAAGEIRHAIAMGIFNAAFGPECTKAQLDTNNWSVIGKTCGTALGPAAKFEWAGARKASERGASENAQALDPIYTLDKTIPEGMRFVLNISDAEMENFISSKGYTGAKANTTRIIIRALRDYGIIPLDTGGTVNLQTAGGVSPRNRELWKQLGITSTEDDKLLYGLFNETNLYVVEPPTNNCVDGRKTKFYCAYTSSNYFSATSSTSTILPPTTTNPPTTTATATANPTVTAAAPGSKTSPQPGTSTPPPTTTGPTAPIFIEPILGTLQWNVSSFEFGMGASFEWKASASTAGIKQYTILKDGQKIYEGQATKFIDFRVVDGKSYQYQIYAVDLAGKQSAVTTLQKTYRCVAFGFIDCKFQ
ncbi:MAG: hypothetical protein U0526_03720 [Candidatus Saccharibacteria bacterium]